MRGRQGGGIKILAAHGEGRSGGGCGALADARMTQSVHAVVFLEVGPIALSTSDLSLVDTFVCSLSLPRHHLHAPDGQYHRIDLPQHDQSKSAPPSRETELTLFPSRHRHLQFLRPSPHATCSAACELRTCPLTSFGLPNVLPAPPHVVLRRARRPDRLRPVLLLPRSLFQLCRLAMDAG